MKQFCDVVVWEKPAITVSYRTGMTVFEEGLRDGRWVAHLLVPLAGLAVIGYTWWGLDVPAKVLGVVWMAAGTAYYLVLRFVLKREVTLGG